MIEQEITLLTNGRISFQKCGNGLQFGYSKNRGVYSIKVKTSGEWNGLTIRAFWHIPDIKEPITSLLVDNVIRVPALVTSYKGEGRIVFEGSDGAKTVTSAQPIPALSGVNTVITDADSVTVTGRADPIKRITDLEDAVASMTNT